MTVPWAARSLKRDWDRLTSPAAPQSALEPATVELLPEPAQRWLSHAISAGTPLFSSVELAMRGVIRLGRWRAFTARQVLGSLDGFIWAATARVAGLPVVGFDRYTDGVGQLRWRLLGLVPVMSGTSTDITRSAAGRLAAEGAVLLPTGFRRLSWTAGPTPDVAVATCRIGDAEESVQLRVGPGGQLLGLVMQRWGNPNGEPYGRYPFGVAVEAERTFAGVTIPGTFRAGWWWDTARQAEGEFFRAEITAATFR